MSTSTYTGIMTTLDVEVSIPCKIFALPVAVLNNIRYIDPKKITTGVIEIATCEFAQHLFILNAKVGDSQIKGISVTGLGADSLCHEDTFWGPVIREAWKLEDVDIDKLDTIPVDVDEFIKNLHKLSMHEYRKQTETKAMSPCYVMVRVLDFGKLGVLVCFYVCGHWVQCVHLAPKP